MHVSRLIVILKRTKNSMLYGHNHLHYTINPQLLSSFDSASPFTHPLSSPFSLQYKYIDIAHREYLYIVLTELKYINACTCTRKTLQDTPSNNNNNNCKTTLLLKRNDKTNHTQNI